MKSIIFKNKDLKYKYIIYEDGTIYNSSTNKYINPTKDPRRPTEPPIVYFKKKNNKRIFRYYDDFMAEMFLDGYTKGCTVHHIDGNINNCNLENLKIANGLDAIKTVFNDSGKWKQVDIDLLNDYQENDTKIHKLYYDYYICSDGRLFNGSTCSYVKPFEDKRDRNKGYLRYNLYRSKNINDVIHISAARLVAYHFLPIIENKTLVLYKDNNPKNVNVDNLYFGDVWDSLCKDIEDNNRIFNTLHYGIIGEERWKRLKDLPNSSYELEDEYWVSSYGRVYNMSKKFYPIQQRSKPNINNQSYLIVELCVRNSERHFIHYFVHRLVAYMFCKNKHPKEYNTVNHINGNPECNLSINLEWTSIFNNVHHAIEINLKNTSKFDKTVDSEGWRISTLIAWSYVMSDNNSDNAFKLFNLYISKYNDNIPQLNKSEFIKYFNNNIIIENSDLKKQYDFYNNEHYINKICI